MDPWNILNEVKAIGLNSLEAKALAPEGSRWFAGHFPGEPILPGIAMMQAVYSAIREDAVARGEEVGLSSLRRVRFTSPVRPGDQLNVSLNREVMEQDMVYIFKVAVKDSVVCSGMMTVVKAAQKIKVKKEDGDA